MKFYYFKDFLFSIFVVLISNVVLYCLALWTGTERVEFNLDYFIPLFLLIFRSKIIFVVSFFLLFCIDFLTIFSQIFPFIRFDDLFYLLKFSFISSSTYKIYALFLILSFSFQIYFIYRFFSVKNIKNYLILFNVLVFLYGYNIYFVGSDNVNFWKPNGNNIVSSQLLNYIDYRNRGFIKNYNTDGEVFQKNKMEGATKGLFIQSNYPEKILLVINESWGVPGNEAIQNKVLASILNNPKATNIKINELSFNGFTIGGELRELCQKAPLHFNLKYQEKGFEECLPNLMKKQGYHTIAVHGALGLMYDRQDWYPRAGFSELLFRDKGLNLPESNCYSFPGNCDKDIAYKISEKIVAHQKLFLYWLTLNTHAIYDLRDLTTDHFICEEFGIKPTVGSCRNLKLQTQFFITLSKMLDTGNLSGTNVIVVGDHQPPMIKGEKQIFVEQKVPILEFTVK